MSGDPPFEPFLLATGRGERFCVYHAASGRPRGAMLYVPPFAEEMNKSRRMAALQSRRLAAAGYAVLQIDLYGCGDSDGELRDATWELWKHDLESAERWLRQRAHAPVHLWGLRLGALLALDYARSSGERYAGFILWQPVLSGIAHIAQFLRLRVAMSLTAAAEKMSTQDLRDALDAGMTVEVAGYDLSPALAAAISALSLEALAPRGAPVRWFELVGEDRATLPFASRRVVEAWAAHGVDAMLEAVVGASFWSAVELVDSPALLEATAGALADCRACA